MQPRQSQPSRLAPQRPSRTWGALASCAAALALGGLLATTARAQTAPTAPATPGTPPAATSTGDTAAEVFAKADVNRDGRLSREECQALPAIAARFDTLDKDRDGALAPEEFAAGFPGR